MAVAAFGNSLINEHALNIGLNCVAGIANPILGSTGPFCIAALDVINPRSGTWRPLAPLDTSCTTPEQVALPTLHSV